jgi:hypothetical protein
MSDNSIFLLPQNSKVRLIKTVDKEQLLDGERGVIVKVFENLKAYLVEFSESRFVYVMKEWVKPA